MNWFYNMKMAKKLILSFSLVSLVAAFIGYVGILSLEKANDSDRILYENNTIPIRQIGAISVAFQRQRTDLVDLLYAKDAEFIKEQLKKISDREKQIDDTLPRYEKSIMTEQGRKDFQELENSWNDFKSVKVEMINLYSAGKRDEAASVYHIDLELARVRFQNALAAVDKQKISLAEARVEQNSLEAHSSIKWMLTLLILGVVIAIGLGIFISRIITGQLKLLSEVSKKVSAGDVDVSIEQESTDEIGELMGAFKILIENIKQQASIADRISEGDLNLVVDVRSDKDLLNKSFVKVINTLYDLVKETALLTNAGVEGKLKTRGNFEKFKGDYKEIVLGINATLDAVIGPLNMTAEYVDRIAKGDIPNKISDTYRGDFNAIKNNLNLCIDAVNALVTDAGVLSKAAIEGKLATRADATKHQGDFRKVVQGVNDTLDSVIGPLNVAAEYVDRISKGDIPNKITDNYNGDFNEIKNNLNGCIDAVNVLVADAGLLAKAGIAGKLATRADESKHRGDFRKIVMGVNETLDAVVGPINTASIYIERIGRGDIPSKITDNYHGDFAKLVESINNCIDGLHGLVETNNVLNKLAKKDFTAKVEGHYEGIFDELKTSLNFTIDEISGLLSQIIVNSEEIYNGSEQVADASQSLSQGAAESASSLEEISSSMSEISSQTKINAENANQSSLLAHNSKSSSEKGDTEMHALMNAMSEIGESSKSISKIIKVIDEIAFQTNLLALNAAVEAARAGRQGKGFAVVAEEVRNLAARSAKAAKETAELIEDAVKKSGRGSEIAQRTASALNEIQIGSTKVADIVGEIAAASNEQAHGIAQINIGLSQIDKVTQQNTAGAEETAAAAEELSSQSLSMRDLVSAFKLSNTFQRASSNTHKQKKREIGTGQLRQGSKKLLSPNDIIRLDDEEFGKY